MAEDSVLLIKLNADAENAKKAFDDVTSKTEDLQASLDKAGQIGAVAFAALAAEIGVSIKLYGDAEQASLQLANALQNQGIYSAELVETYKNQAEAISSLTGVEATQITQAQTVLTGFLHQKEISEDLTTATVNLAKFMGIDLNSAATLIGRTIGGTTNAFARYGLQLSNTATEADRYQKVLDYVNQKSAGAAVAANSGVASIKGLETAFISLEEKIGEKFAPTFTTVVGVLTSFFKTISESDALISFTAGALAVGAALAAIVALVPVALAGFVALSAAAAALGVSLGTLSISLAGIPVLVGLVVAAGVALYKNWDTISEKAQVIFGGLATFFEQAFGGLADVIQGAIELNADQIKAGVDKITGSLQAGKDKAIAIADELAADKLAIEIDSEEKQDAVKKAAADRAAALEADQQAIRVKLAQSEAALLNLQAASASQELIQNKTQEIATLKALQEDQSAEQKKALTDRYAILLAQEQDLAQQDLQRSIEFEQLKQKTIEQLQEEGVKFKYDLDAQQQAALQAQVETQKQAEQKVASDRLKTQITSQNTFKENEIKFGKAIAVIDQVLSDTRLQNANNAAGNLVALENSKNDTLKTIGKAAALTQLAISTATSAMNIFEGFSTIPIVGYALGIAGAAAAIAYGGEQAATIVAANEGGLITGGIPGEDSVHALLTPGELVVPKQNFEQVVGAVQNQGGANDDATQSAILSVLQNINAKFSNPQSVTINGDVTTDRSFIDALTKQISDAVQFRNQRFYGVRN